MRDVPVIRRFSIARCRNRSREGKKKRYLSDDAQNRRGTDCRARGRRVTSVQRWGEKAVLHFNCNRIFYGFCFLTLPRPFRRWNGGHAGNVGINIDRRGERVAGVVAGGSESGLLPIPHQTLGRVWPMWTAGSSVCFNQSFSAGEKIVNRRN